MQFLVAKNIAIRMLFVSKNTEIQFSSTYARETVARFHSFIVILILLLFNCVLSCEITNIWLFLPTKMVISYGSTGYFGDNIFVTRLANCLILYLIVCCFL